MKIDTMLSSGANERPPDGRPFQFWRAAVSARYFLRNLDGWRGSQFASLVVLGETRLRLRRTHYSRQRYPAG